MWRPMFLQSTTHFRLQCPFSSGLGPLKLFARTSGPFADEMPSIHGNKVHFIAQDKAAHDLLMNLSLFKLEEGFFAAMRQACKFFNNAE